MKTVYLCGGINKLSDSDAKDWRQAAKTELTGQFQFLDPMRRDYRGIEEQSVNLIINGDLEDISASDILLVNATRASWGTAMEIYEASRRGPFMGFHEKGRLIVTVCPEDRPSPWLVGHSTYVVKTFAEAFQILKRYADENRSERAQSPSMQNCSASS